MHTRVMTRWVLVALSVGCLAATGCQKEAGPGSGQARSRPAPGGEGAAPKAAGCPVGRFQVVKITPGEAAGGDVDVRLSGGTSMTIELTVDGTWTLTDDGDNPLEARVSAPGAGSVSGTATVRGSLRGTYARAGSTYGFRQEGGDGTVALSSPAGRDSRDIETVGPALVPGGTATITCSGTKATIKSDSVTMTLKRTGDSPAGESAAGGGSGGGAGGGDEGGAGGDLTLRGRLKVHNVRCGGRDIVVASTVSTVNLQGTCGKVRITGDKNTVNVAGGGTVVITGRLNTVNVRGGAQVDDRGSLNNVNES